MRHLVLTSLLALSVATAAASPPTGYQCAPGTTLKDVGCSCPARHTSERDAEGVAICKAALVVTRRPTVKLAVTITDRLRPVPPAAAPTRPSLEASSLLETQGPPTSPIRSEQLVLIQTLIDETPDSEAEEKADLYFRLAEAHAQQHRYWQLKAIEKDATAPAKAKEALLQATGAYRTIIEKPAFRKYPRLDKALFFYASMLQGANYLKEARAAYQRLVTEFPSSAFIPEAYVAFADFYFDGNELASAEQAYKKVLQFSKSRMFWYAMYKLGWIYLGQNKSTEAFDTLYKVVIGAFDQVTTLKPLFKASRYELAWAISNTQPGRSLALLHRLRIKDASQLASMVADELAQRGHHERSAGVYLELTQLSGNLDHCIWQSALARETLLTPGVSKTATVELCPTEVAAFKSWAATNGIDVK